MGDQGVGDGLAGRAGAEFGQDDEVRSEGFEGVCDMARTFAAAGADVPGDKAEGVGHRGSFIKFGDQDARLYIRSGLVVGLRF